MLSWNGLVALFSSLASVSRLTWAFAKDRGLPFPDFFGRVHPTLRIPLNALVLVLTIVSLLMLINIASTSAVYAILSLNNLALYMSYLQIVGSFFIHKLRGHPITFGPFALGKWGYAINLYAIGFLIFIIIWLPFPPYLPVTGSNMNYSGPIFGFVLLAVSASLLYLKSCKILADIPTSRYRLLSTGLSGDTSGLLCPQNDLCLMRIEVVGTREQLHSNIAHLVDRVHKSRAGAVQSPTERSNLQITKYGCHFRRTFQYPPRIRITLDRSLDLWCAVRLWTGLSEATSASQSRRTGQSLRRTEQDSTWKDDIKQIASNLQSRVQ